MAESLCLQKDLLSMRSGCPQLLPFIPMCLPAAINNPLALSIRGKRLGRVARLHTSQKLLNQRSAISPIRLFFRRDDYCRGYAVAGLHVQQADALGVAPGFANRF